VIVSLNPNEVHNFQQTYNVDVEYVGVIINQGRMCLDEMVCHSVQGLVC